VFSCRALAVLRMCAPPPQSEAGARIGDRLGHGGADRRRQLR
jgi:hypothetical protein